MNGEKILQNALCYLNADGLLHAAMILPLQRGSAEIIYADADGVLLKESKSSVRMLSSCDYRQGQKIIGLLPTAEIMLLHQEFMVEPVRQKFRFSTARECVQAVYQRKEAPPLTGSLSIKPLGLKYLPTVLAHYHAVDDPQYVAELLREGVIYGGFSGETLVGFAGSHLEGGIGLLVVFEEYRRHGYAAELESYMINLVLAAGQIPYGHIFSDNQASLNLQTKLGFSFCPQKVYWLF